MPLWLTLFMAWCSGSTMMGAIVHFSDCAFWRAAFYLALSIFFAAAATGLLS